MNAIVARQFSSFRGNALLLFACLLLAQLTAARAATELQFSAATYEVTELEWSSPLKIRVTASPPPTNRVEVTLSRSGGTAGPEDYGPSLPMTVYIFAGQSSAEVFVTGVDDGLPEPDETLNLRLSSPTDGAVLGDRKEVVVTIHNTTTRVEFLGQFPGSENDAVSVRAVRRGDTNAAVTVDYATGTGGTATPGVDFTPTAGRIVFAPGEREKTLSLTNLLDDGEVEFTETMELRFAISSGEATLSQTNLFVGISDNEYPPNLDLNFVPPPGERVVTALAVQTDGKILLGGSTYQVGDWVASLVRLNADGSLDPSFQAHVDFAINNVGVAEGGRILVAGAFSLEASPRPGLTRLLPDGRVDPTFKPDTSVLTEVVNNSGAWPYATFQRNGKILFGFDSRLRRLNANGSADEVFNAFARQYPDDQQTAVEIAEQADGRILFAQIVENEYQLRRLNSDGSPDPTFQPETKAFAPLPLADGRLVASSAGSQGLVRLRADGTVDPTFDATFLKPFWPGAVGEVEGKLYVTFVSGEQTESMVRLKDDGSLDPSFAEVRVTVPFGFSFGYRGVGKMVAHAGGLLCVAQRQTQTAFSQVNGVTRPDLARILLDGVPTAAFALEPQPNLDGGATSARFGAENSGAVVIRALRLGDTSQPATVHYATRDGAAHASVNYEAVEGTLTFAPRETMKLITVPLINDEVFRGAPDFQVVFSQPTPAGAVVGPPLSVRIIDDEPGILPGSFQLTSSGYVQFEVLGANAQRELVVESSSDLKHWDTRGYVREGSRSWSEWLDASPNRFYRVRPE